MIPQCKRCGEELVRDVCPCCEPGLLILKPTSEEMRQLILKAALGDLDLDVYGMSFDEVYEKLSSNHDKGDDPE